MSATAAHRHFHDELSELKSKLLTMSADAQVALGTALDPIATAKIEALIRELKEHYTIVIVTHNMQQAARVSDFTAFLYLGTLVEFGPTERIFTTPEKKETEDYNTGRFG